MADTNVGALLVSKKTNISWTTRKRREEGGEGRREEKRGEGRR